MYGASFSIAAPTKGINNLTAMKLVKNNCKNRAIAMTNRMMMEVPIAWSPTPLLTK